MDKRYIFLLVVLLIIVAIGFYTKWTFRLKRSTYDEKISEEDVERMERELAASGNESYEEEEEYESEEREEFV